jgi:hypothetical protein
MRHWIAVALLCFSAGAQSQARLPPGVRGPDTGMATRSVATYLDLERSMLDALQRGDRDAVRRILGDDFELRAADGPDGTPADAWLEGELRSRIVAGTVRDLAVREFDDIASVSFLLDSRRKVRNGQVASTLYVIDVWRQSSHKLLVRYVSKPVRVPPPPARPTGRE